MDTNETTRTGTITHAGEAGALGGPRASAAIMAGWTLLLWVIALFVTHGGTAGVLDGDLLPAPVATGLVALVMLVAFGVALGLRRRALEAAERANALTTPDRPPSREAMMERETVKSSLFAARVTLDIAGFFCGGVFLMMATPLMLLIALPLLVAGIVLTFPRQEWYSTGGDVE